MDFKIKQNLIKVEFLGPWPTVKTFIVDESKTVADLTAEIGGKIGLKNPEEFSLQVRETGSGGKNRTDADDVYNFCFSYHLQFLNSIG